MRIVAVQPGPDFSVADVHAGWLGGLRELGVQVVDFNLGDRLDFYARAALERDGGRFELALDGPGAMRLAMQGLLGTLYQVRPDVLLVTSGFYLTADVMQLIRSRGTRLVLLHTESPYEDDRQVERAAYADLNLINDPTNIDRFRQAAPTVYMPHAYRPQLHQPGPPAPGYASDFCFVGTGFPSRVAFLEQVDWTGVDVALAGHWQDLAEASPLRKFVAHDLEDCCPADQTALLYCSTKASANLYRREADRPELAAGWAMGPREVELAAAGVFFLRDPRGEGDELLPTLPTFTSPGEFESLLHWWLAHDTERAAAAAAARAAVADRTFTAHARQLLQLLGA